jgi:hypothetical protein
MCKNDEENSGVSKDNSEENVAYVYKYDSNKKEVYYFQRAYRNNIDQPFRYLIILKELSESITTFWERRKGFARIEFCKYHLAKTERKFNMLYELTLIPKITVYTLNLLGISLKPSDMTDIDSFEKKIEEIYGIKEDLNL